MSAPSQFEYLLNAMERAAQEEKPAEHGYAEKRRAVLNFVRDLEGRAARAEGSYNLGFRDGRDAAYRAIP